MKCPVCGHKVRPSKKYPGKYLCDTCRKRLPASAVIPDDTDIKNTRPASHSSQSASRRKHPSSRQQAFFDDPLKGPEIYHSTAAAMRSMKKLAPGEENTESKKDTKEKEETEEVSSSGKEYYTKKSIDLETSPVAEPAAISEQADQPVSDPASAAKEDVKNPESDASSDDTISPKPVSGKKKKKKKQNRRLPFLILILIVVVIVVVFLFSKTHTSSDTGTGSSSDTSAPKKTGDATKDIYKQGETATYNSVEITLDSYVESEGDDWSVPTEGNEFMFVHLTIVNKTSDDLVISSMASFENYCDDTKLDYSAAAFTALATTSDQPKLDGTIAPGETLEGYLSLEVPLNWSAVEIRYVDKIWSDDAVHFQIDRQE